MEELEALKSTDCPECPGPPPKFRLPPPPRPSFLTEGSFCSEAPLTELEDCVAVSIIDASYRTNASLQSTALIITCSVILLLMATIVSVAFWKHKRKVQSLLPCKGASGMGAATPESRPVRPLAENPMQAQGTVIMYEDHADSLSYSQLHNHRYVNHPAQPTIEMLDVKDVVRRVFVCSNSSPDIYTSQDLYDPVYQELNNDTHLESERELNARNRSHKVNECRYDHYRSTRRQPAHKKPPEVDEISIDETSEIKMLTASKSVWGSSTTGGRVSKERRTRAPRSLDRHRKDKHHDVGEFHEGKLLDALLRLYPSVAGITGLQASGSGNPTHQQSMTTVAHRMPYFLPPMGQQFRAEEVAYESVPVLAPLRRHSRDRKNAEAFTWKDYNHGRICDRDFCDQESDSICSRANECADVYSQPADRLGYDEDKYEHPVYYEPGESRVSRDRLYQAAGDSVFGSDSGYSQHTSSTIETSATSDTKEKTKSGYRKDKRNSVHRSVEYIVS